MKISSSTIGMESERNYRLTGKDAYMLRFSSGKTGRLPSQSGAGQQSAASGTGAQTNKQGFGKSRRLGLGGTSRSASNNQASSLDEMTSRCMEYLFRLFFGDKSGFEKYQPQPYRYNGQEVTASISHAYSESETTSFSASGKAVTEDGREVSFSLDVEMSRSFTETFTTRLNINPASMCDPLVLNLEGGSAAVTDKKFFFDIDNDGQEDSISELSYGSGYLALDRDGNGKIDNGGELFGTASGDGFADLAKLDSDGNGWIDENDGLFNKLKIWVRDKDGKEHLYGLAEKGVGAICLQNARTDFSLNSMRDNHVNGAVRRTGIFLYENGASGTVQHLDLAR